MSYTGNKIIQIKKRDGKIVDFEADKIALAIFKAMRAVSEPDKEKADELADQVIEILNKKFQERSIPCVEEIQDIVETVLLDNKLLKVGKAFIIYRDQRNKMRELRTMVNSDELMEGYLKQMDWRVRENSNMDYSLQGLNNYVASTVSANYWLNKIYPPNIRDRHVSGDFHIHDLQILGPYCCGWDLKDLLLRGFSGVRGKVESKAPKHMVTAMSQLFNFFYTLQGEAAGAQAISSFDTLIAPFIRYDNLNYEQVKQNVQMFLFNMNVPTRVGFQCLSEDTEILTPGGWRGCDDLKKGDLIKTYNVKNGKIENKPVKKLFSRHYEGIMYNLKNRIQDQLISPSHRVVRKKFQSEEFVLEPIEDIVKMKSPFIIPIAGKNARPDVKLSDAEIKLACWIIAEGTVEHYTSHRHCRRVTIYQSAIKNKTKYDEIIDLLKKFRLQYAERDSTPALGDSVKMIRLTAESSRQIHKIFGANDRVDFIPAKFLEMSGRQSKLFLETYLKADGTEKCKIATTRLEILDGLQQIAVNAGYGFTVLVRKPTIGKKLIYILRLVKHSETYIARTVKVDYNGTIWCPSTDNQTVIARRNGKVFITGNCPFTNVTMDLFVPSTLANEPAIVGGLPQKEVYGEFQKEMDMFNQAFIEVMTEGDKKGRVLSWPIPTYNVTKEWDWDAPIIDKIMDMTAKYGIPYFSNFVNSDMKPEDSRSMCPLAGDEKVLIKSSRGRGVEYSEIRNIYEGNGKQDVYEIYSAGKFVKGKFNKFNNQKMLKVTLENGQEIKMSEAHLNFTMQGGKELILKGSELNNETYLPYSLNAFEGSGGNAELGYFVGAYAGDGSFDKDTAVVFSLEDHFKKEVIVKLEKIAKKHFAGSSKVVKDDKTKLVTLKIFSKAAVGLCRDFVEGKERNKHYSAKLFIASTEFRKAVLAGHYATDGGNRHRIYTSSVKMVESLNMLAATLGTTTSVYKDDRDGRFGKEPNYAVLVYQLNRQKYGKIWFKNKDKLWVRIKEIKSISNSAAYCFEVEKGAPVFTVGTTGILTHNCRLRLDNRELRRRGGSLFGANPLTGSLGVVTINLARLGFISKDKEEFFEKLAELMDLAKESLLIKRQALEKFTEGGLYPYSRYYLNSVKERFGEYWKNHFNTIGINGANEACLNLLKANIASPEGHKFARQILDFMRERLMDYQNETNHLFNLEATPAEGTGYRFAKIDKAKFPEIIVANEEAVRNSKAAPYYTNSTHLPVNYTDDIFEALRLQDDLQTRYTGGTVLHGFVGERLPSVQSTKVLVRKIAENFRLPYFTITPTFSVCPLHGYIEGEHEYCPTCDEEMGYVSGGAVEEKQESLPL
ncbi:MAG: anaerobic ribonucleoside-triphosphate reductase [Parcubacteria group bacterium]